MTRRLLAGAALALCATLAYASEQEARTAYLDKDYARSAALYVAEFEKEGDAMLLYNAACSFALAGDREQAFRTLERAMETGYVDGAGTEKDSDFSALHGDPRWTTLIAAMKDRQALEARLFDSPAIATPFADNLSEDEKVAGLSKLWSEVKYNFVYVDTLKQLDWDKLYVEAIPKVKATTSTEAYYRVLMELIAKLHDGHTNVYPPSQLFARMFGRPMFTTQPVEGRVFVKAVFSPELEAKGIVPGVEVTAVDGLPVAQYVARDIAPVSSASTPQDLERRTHQYGFLAGAAGEQAQVTFAGKHRKAFTVAVPRVAPADWQKAAPKASPFEFRMLPGGIAYVALNGFGNQAAADGFMAAWPQVSQAKALVIDIRRNGGGNSDVGYRVLATLTDKPFFTTKWSTRQYLPTFRAWGRPAKMYEKKAAPWQPDGQRLFKGPVAVLTSGATYSAAEDFALSFDSMQRGAIIGEPTGGSTGQPLVFGLPGGGTARVCTKQDTYADGRKFVGIGIQPTVPVRQTVADLGKGRDTVLDAAVKHLSHALRSQ